VSVSFDVAKSIGIRGKPFSNEDFIKMSWLADNLFHDFDHKDAIIRRIEDLSISRNTIKKRILSMNIENRLIHVFNQSSFLSICIDESKIPITSSARLSIISRFCFNEVREELIKLASIPAKTTGENQCTVTPHRSSPFYNISP